MCPPTDHPAKSLETIPEVQEPVHLQASSGNLGDTPLLSSSQAYLYVDKDQTQAGQSAAAHRILWGGKDF